MSQLARNVVHFARLLRAAGVRCGPDRVALALRSLGITGVGERGVVKSALCATLVSRHDDLALFAEAFDQFWRDPDLAAKMRAQLLPRVEGRARGADTRRRLASAFFPHAPQSKPREPERVELDAALTFSDDERLRQVDFESMSREEFDAAARIVARLRWSTPTVPTRRMQPALRRGVIDWPASARAAIRLGGDAWPLRRRRPRRVVPPWVILADISGSMEQGTRMLLHFIHAFARAQRGAPVEVFVFGTRLTRVTRLIALRDADAALAAIARAVPDWGGGTRIGAALGEFNRRWARRVLGRRARVMLVTDGLDRDDRGALGEEMPRLKRSARELLWLNPLLRFEGFEARAHGPRAILPHVSRHLAVHNLASLEALAAALERG